MPLNKFQQLSLMTQGYLAISATRVKCSQLLARFVYSSLILFFRAGSSRALRGYLGSMVQVQTGTIQNQGINLHGVQPHMEHQTKQQWLEVGQNHQADTPLFLLELASSDPVYHFSSPT